MRKRENTKLRLIDQGNVIIYTCIFLIILFRDEGEVSLHNK